MGGFEGWRGLNGNEGEDVLCDSSLEEEIGKDEKIWWGLWIGSGEAMIE